MNADGVTENAVEVGLVRLNQADTLCAAEEDSGATLAGEGVAEDVRVLRSAIRSGTS